MYDFILFAILLILIAASVALVFLILFGESSKRNLTNNKSANKSSAKDGNNENEITKNDIELMKKFCHTFSDEEINRFKEIDKKINKFSKKSDKGKY